MDSARRPGHTVLLVSGVLAGHAIVLSAFHVDAPIKAPERVLAIQVLSQPPEPRQIPVPAQVQPPALRPARTPQAKVPQDPAAERSAVKLAASPTTEPASPPPLAPLPATATAPAPAPAPAPALAIAIAIANNRRTRHACAHRPSGHSDQSSSGSCATHGIKPNNPVNGDGNG